MHLKRKFLASPGGMIFDVCNGAFMILFCLTIIFPVWDMLVMSFAAPRDISFTSLNLWPKNIVLQAYTYCFANPKFFTAYLVSISRALSGTAYHILVTVMAAFVLTRTEMPFRKTLTLIWLIPMFFGGGLIPTYLHFRNIGLTNNYLVYILPMAFSMYTAIIVRNFFYSLDHALEESAIIDGASALQVLFHIYLPLSKPVLATITLWSLVNHWNAWFDNMIYVTTEKLLTLQYLLRRIIMEAELFASDAAAFAMTQNTEFIINSETIKAATTVLIVVPIIAVYPFLQRYFVKGIMIGAVKG
jgi:putative aldouronate transport system permease protein